MSKEQLLKILETLDFEEIKCMTLSYYKKKPSQYNYGDNDCNPKTICIGTDLEKLINEYRGYQNQEIQEIYRELEKLKEEGK